MLLLIHGKKNGVEVIIVDNIKWLNEKHIEKQLDYATLRSITQKYPKHLKIQRQELQECVKQPCRRFLRDDFAVQVIMDCRTTPSISFKTRLGFNQQDPVMTEEQSLGQKLGLFFQTKK